MQLDLYNGCAEALHLGDRFSSFCPLFLWLSPRSSVLLSFGRLLHRVATPWRTASYLLCLTSVSISVPRVPRLCSFTRAEPGLPGAWLHTPGGRTVAYTVAWGVPFGRLRNESVHLRAPPPHDLTPPPSHHGKVRTHSGGGEVPKLWWSFFFLAQW